MHASVAQWQSRAAPPHRHGFDSCRPHHQPFAWEANLVKARPSEAWLRQDVEAAERWARNLPQAPCHPFAGSDPPFSPSLRARGAGGSGPLGQIQSGHAQGPRISLARRFELGSSPRCLHQIFPDHPIGRSPGCYPGDPGSSPGRGANSPRSSNWRDTRFSTEQSEFKSPSRRHQRTRSSTG